MKKVLSLFIIALFIFCNTEIVDATSGFLKSNSIVSCNGVTYGQHGDGHWHVAVKNEDGRYNASGSPIYSNPCGNLSNNNSNNNSDNIVPSKSDDNTLKSLTVNNENVEISENMNYKTKETFVTIEAIVNDNKASVKYNKYNDLSMGENIISLIVIAENGNEKEYKLNIIREKELSDNKNIKIKVDDKELDFINFQNGDVVISSDENKINITYDLEDENAKVNINGNENLKVGKNEIIIKVTAENGEEQEYKIIVNKLSKTEDIIYGIISLAFIGFIILGIIYLIKKLKKK